MVTEPADTETWTGPAPPLFGRESPFLTMTSQVPSAQVLSLLPSAAVRGGLVVLVGVTDITGAGEAAPVVALVTGAGAGELGPAPQPAASRAAGTVMSAAEAVVRNRFIEDLRTPGCAGGARTARMVAGTGQSGAAEIRFVP
jgi:hypothetical protein